MIRNKALWLLGNVKKNQNETKEQIIRVGERDVKKRKDEKRREG